MLYTNLHDVRSYADSNKTFSVIGNHRMMYNITVGFRNIEPYGNYKIIDVIFLVLFDTAKAACFSRDLTCCFLRWFHHAFSCKNESNYRHHAVAILQT
jgi:hypothetical protein